MLDMVALCHILLLTFRKESGMFTFFLGFEVDK